MTNEILIDTWSGEDFLFYLFDRAVNSGRKMGELIQSRPYFDFLVELYSLPVSGVNPKQERSYHSFDHIAEGVRDLVEVEENCGCSESFDDVLLAWLYHDCVYTVKPPSGDNEEKSAKIALEQLMLMGFSGERAGRIHDLVMWTKHKINPPEDDYEANLIVDIDLLRASVDDFEAFSLATEMIREEFSFLPDKEWIEGRVKFWKSFLKLKGNRIYRTDYYENLNRIALENINKEISNFEQLALSKGA